MPTQKLLKLKLWGLSLLTSAAASLLYANPSVAAVASIILNYRDIQTVVPIADFKIFTNGGEMSKELQEFFERIPLSPEVARNFLADPIIPSKSFKLDRTTAKFLTIQFNKIVGSPYSREPTDSLETVVVSAIESDNSASILELIEEHPEPQVRVELSRLERIQNDINLFIEKIQPIMGVVEELLEDAACGCVTPTGPAKISFPTNLSEQIMLAQSRNAELYAQVPTCLDGLRLTTATIKPEAIAPLKAINAETKALLTPKLSLITSNEQLLSQATPDNPTFTSIAQELVFTYGPFQGSLAISELSTFAKTGEISRPLRFYLNLAKANPESLRNFLTKEVNVNLKFLDKGLNSILGEYALFQVGKILHTRSQQANIQALRSALVLSASKDNRISLIEFLEKYPLQRVYLDGAKLTRLLRSVKHTGGARGFAQQKLERVEDFLVELQATAALDECECESD